MLGLDTGLGLGEAALKACLEGIDGRVHEMFSLATDDGGGARTGSASGGLAVRRARLLGVRVPREWKREEIETLRRRENGQSQRESDSKKGQGESSGLVIVLAVSVPLLPPPSSLGTCLLAQSVSFPLGRVWGYQCGGGSGIKFRTKTRLHSACHSGVSLLQWSCGVEEWRWVLGGWRRRRRPPGCCLLS